jgi:hypothetical protein
VVRRLAGLSAGLAGAERRFNLPVLRAAALREDMVWAGARRNLSSRAKPVAPKKLAPTCAAKRILPRSACKSEARGNRSRTEVADELTADGCATSKLRKPPLAPF